MGPTFVIFGEVGGLGFGFETRYLSTPAQSDIFVKKTMSQNIFSLKKTLQQ